MPRKSRAANAQEKERLIAEGKTASNNLGLDFSEKKQDIKNKLAQLGEDIKVQTNADLGESLQLQLNKASTSLQGTLDNLSDKFRTGKIEAADYWNSAKNSLNSYARELYRIRQAQLEITFKKPGLTEPQAKNEKEKATQEFNAANDTIAQKGKSIWQDLVEIQANEGAGKSGFFIQLQTDIDETTTSLLEFYKIYKQNPMLADDPQFAIDKDFAQFAKDVKDEYAAYFTDVQTFEEKILLTQQANAVKAYTTKIEWLKKFEAYWKEVGNPSKEKEVQNEITALESKLLGVRAKNYLEYIKFKKEKLDEYAQKELEVSALLAGASEDEATARLNLQKTASEINAAHNADNVAAVREMVKIERETALKAKESASERLTKDKEAALKRVENEKDAANLKTDINEAYRLKELGLEEEYQAKMLEIGEAYKDKLRAAARRDAINRNPFGATVAYGISGALGIEGIDDAIDKATSKTETIKAVYEDLGATVLDVFSSMTAATQALLENYILTGNCRSGCFQTTGGFSNCGNCRASRDKSII